MLDLPSGRLRIIARGTGARYVVGSLVYTGARGELFRQPFDIDSLEPTGAPEQLVTGLFPVVAFGEFSFDASEAGALVYRFGPRRYGRAAAKLSVLDSTGRERRVVPARSPWGPRFARDGLHILYGAFAPGLDRSDVWVTDIETGSTERVTIDGEDKDNNDAVWKPDGSQVAYDRRTADGGKDIWVRALGGGAGRQLVSRPGDQWPTDWANDGRALLFTEYTPDGDVDVWMQPMDGAEPRPLLNTLAQESGARVSPDGRWVAYTSDESGRREVYVQAYPNLGRKTLVSATGGVNPVWRHDGRAIYYWKMDQLIVAQVEPGGADSPLVVRNRTPLFRAPYVETYLGMYDVSPDGKRFAVVTAEGASRLVISLNALGTVTAPTGARR